MPARRTALAAEFVVSAAGPDMRHALRGLQDSLVAPMVALSDSGLLLYSSPMAAIRIVRAALALAVACAAVGQVSDPPALAREASAAMSSREFARAERIYRQLSGMYPDEPGFALNLGLALYSSGEYAQATLQLSKFLESRPDHGPAWLLVGLSHQKLGHPAEAVQPLRRAVQAAPSDDHARLELADALLRSDQPLPAAAEFQILVSKASSNTRAWLGLGLSYAELSRQAAERLEQTAPRSEYRYLLLAHAAAAQQRFRAAYGHFRAALAVNPAVPRVHEAIAKIYAETGRPDWADAERAKVQLDLPCAQRQLGCWFESGQIDRILSDSERGETPEVLYWRARAFGLKAREAHQQLVALPPSASSYRLLAMIEDLAGRHREAAGVWRRAVELEPANTDLRHGLLRSLHAAGLHEESIRVGEALLEQRPDSAIGPYYWGAALLALGRVDEAIPLLEESVFREGGNRESRVSLATAHLRAGRGSDAVPHLEAALEGREDERLLFQLSRAYQAAGRPADARAALERRRAAIAAGPPGPWANEITPP